MNSTALKGVLLACMIKLCIKVIETLFTIEDPSNFHLVYRNVTESDDADRDVWNATCQFEQNQRASNSSPTVWIYTSRYMLPAVGGFLASARLGHVKALQIGSVVMLLSTVVLSLLVYLGIMCNASPLIPITWLLLPVFFGLTQSTVMYSIFCWYTEPKLRTITSTINYFIVVSGQFIALELLPLNNHESLGPNSSLIYILLSVLSMVLSSWLSIHQPDQEPFEIPHRLKLIKFCQIFGGLILFLFTVADTRSLVYNSELKHYLNGTDDIQNGIVTSPKKINLLAMQGSCLALLIVAFFCKRQISIGVRMQTGILLEAAVAASLSIFTAFKSHSSESVVAIFVAASIIDAIAEVLVMTGAYDLVQQIVPKGAESFVLGIMFTVWGLANLLGRAGLLIVSNWLEGSDSPMVWIYHAVALAFLLACSAYHHFISLPLAHRITIVEDSNEDDELDPLIASNEAA